MKIYGFAGNVIVFLTCKVLFRVKYENDEILKKYDKCIVCPNHSRIYDPAYIYPKLDNMHAVAKIELYKHKIVARFLEYYNTIPVDRDSNDGKALRRALKVFKNEKAELLIFPEGKVLKTKEERGVVKNGAVYIAAMAEVPIIPVYITARPRYFSKVVVRFGEPIFYNKEDLRNKVKIESESKKLIEAIYKLEI